MEPQRMRMDPEQGKNTVSKTENVLEKIEVKQTGDVGFKKGWYLDKSDGYKWMDGTSGQICFLTEGKKKYLEICFLSGRTPQGRPYPIRIFVNGAIHDTFEVSGHGGKFVRSFQLPKHKAGDLHIEFRSEILWRPSDFDFQSPDTRSLGAMALGYAVLNHTNHLEHIDVRKNGVLGFGRGWHSSELEGHKWMDGPSSQICFSTDGRKKYLEIKCLSGIASGGKPYPVQIYVNGDHCDTIEVSGNGDRFVRSLQLPKHKAGDLHIEFRSEIVWRPSDLDPDTPDTRRLGALALLYAVLKDTHRLEHIDVTRTGVLGFGRGWHTSEKEGYKWMDGPSGQICFFTDGGKRHLEIGYVSATTPGDRIYTIQIYVNGDQHDSFEISGDMNKFVRSFQLPKHRRGELIIEFRSDFLWRPFDSDPDSPDKRQLGALALSYALLSKKPNKVILNQVTANNEMNKMRAKVTSYPTWMILGVTNRCNLNCVMCGRNADDKNLKRQDIPDHSLRIVRNAYPYLTEVSLSGGEPLLYKKFGDLVEDLGKNGARGINLFSNGLLLDQAKSGLLLKYSDSIEFIAISIDAATEETYRKIRGGNFNKLINNLLAFSSNKAKQGLHKPRLIFNFVVTRTNVEEIPALVELASRLNVEEISLQKMLEGWDFTSEKDGYRFEYQKENISHYPDLFKSTMEQVLERAEKHKVNIDLGTGIYDFYLAQHPDSKSGKAMVKRKYVFRDNPVINFSRQWIDTGSGGPICKLPWQKVVMYSSGDVYTCCWSKPFANIDDFKKFEDLWNCERIRNIRSELLQGRFAPECKTPNCPSFTRGEKIDITKI